MFLIVSWCAEPMTQRCKLKVKVTLQGHDMTFIVCKRHILPILKDQYQIDGMECAFSTTVDQMQEELQYNLGEI